jgi:hypothetical protein
MMHIVIFAVAAAVTCSLNFSAQARSLAEFDRNIDCAIAAIRRAGPQNCPAYQESISCGKKAAALTTTVNSRNEAMAGVNEARIGARKDGCKVN